MLWNAHALGNEHGERAESGEERVSGLPDSVPDWLVMLAYTLCVLLCLLCPYIANWGSEKKFSKILG